ncbi:Autoinducer 2 sensor kinase/phosphatase LuxQ [bacterium HR09]|nr:Autoinducer 2 sensor kinase/phosphatase LuxQ [bacterium HR09]
MPPQASQPPAEKPPPIRQNTPIGRSPLRRSLPYFALVTTLALSLALGWLLRNTALEQAEKRFEYLAATRARAIVERIERYKMVLQGGVGVFMASGHVSRDEWHRYAAYRQVPKLFPGVLGLGFAPVLSSQDLPAHVASVTREGFDSYQVWPAGEREEYAPVVYFYPLDARHRRMVGYDLLSDPGGRAALLRARDTGEVVLSGKTGLEIDTAQDLGALRLIVAPVYRNAPSPPGQTPTIEGYIFAPLDLPVLLNALFAEDSPRVQFRMYEGTEANPDSLLYASDHGNSRRPLFSSQETVNLLGEQSLLVFETTPLFESGVDLFSHKVVLGGGVIISLLLFLLIKAQTATTAKAVSLATEMTAALKESEARYQVLSDNLPVGVALIGPQLEVLAVNRTLRSWLPPAPANQEATPPELLRLLGLDRARDACPAAQAFGDGQQHSLQIPVTTSLGERVLRLTAVPVSDDDGKVAYVHQTVEDLTVQLANERERTRAMELLTEVGRMARIGGWELDLEKQSLWWTEETYRIHELEPGTPVDLATGIQFYAPEWRPTIIEIARRAIEEGEPFDLEVELITAKGKRIWVRSQGLAERRGGRVVRLYGTLQDITDRKRVEIELRTSEERFRTAMHYSPVGMALVSCQGSFLEVNGALCQLLGYTQEELLQTTIQAVTHPEDLAAELENMRKTMDGELSSYRMRKRYLHKDGHSVEALLSASLVRKADGSPLHFVNQVLDVSAESRAEEERIARLAAEKASQQKSIFLSQMSHEIRTPMNSILGFAQILEHDPSLSPAQRQQVHTITRSGQHLLRLINDILELSRIEAGHVLLKPTVFHLGDLLEEVHAVFRSRAEAKGLRLLFEQDEGLPSWLLADDAKIRQVLVNLLDNAVKFTTEGGVSLRVHCEPAPVPSADGAQLLQLVFEVEDSGPGIASEDLQRIFEPFDQSEAGIRVGGTGLGLAICRKLVEIMGGTLTVESTVGKGSCFRFTAPVEVVEGPPETAALEPTRVVGLKPGNGSWRILVVDDMEDNRELLRALLEPVGFEVREASNGSEALAVFEEWKPHVVLLDIRMPVMDGYEALRRLRATEAGRHTPIIAITASAFREAEKKALASGFSGYLRKPFRAEELYQLLGTCLGLEYVYAHDNSGSAGQSGLQLPLPQAVATLPAELREAMRQAVAEGDMARMAELLNQAAAYDAQVAQGLRALAERYDYETLEKLLGGGQYE